MVTNCFHSTTANNQYTGIVGTQDDSGESDIGTEESGPSRVRSVRYTQKLQGNKSIVNGTLARNGKNQSHFKALQQVRTYICWIRPLEIMGKNTLVHLDVMKPYCT